MEQLAHWEQRLDAYFRRPIQWVGEIPITHREVEELANLLEDYLREAREARGAMRATDALLEKYPLSFVVFLCAFSAYNDQREYWSQLADRLHINPGFVQNNNWRGKAYKILRARGFHVLERDQDAFQFVNTLRLQGGIPHYSLADFFSRIVLPSVNQAEYSAQRAEEVIPRLLQKSYHVDQPVRNFLLYGSEIAAQFLEASRRVARDFLFQHTITDDETPGLPAHVREALISYLERQEEEESVSLSSPRILFDPYGEPHLGLRLPEQAVSIQSVQNEYAWQIEPPGDIGARAILCRVHKGLRSFILREKQEPLMQGPGEYQVSLVERSSSGEKLIRRWKFRVEGLPPSSILAFRAITAGWQLIPSSTAWPATQLLLVMPSDIGLRTEGMRQENPTPLSGAWSGWKAEIWDFETALTVQALRNDQAVGAPVAIAWASPDPYMEGDWCPYQNEEESVPLFVGAAPSVFIPALSSTGKESDLHGWMLSLRSVGPTEPHLDLRKPLSEFCEHLSRTEPYIRLQLDSLLSPEAVGTFHLTLTDPHDSAFPLDFRMWPSLAFRCLPRVFPLDPTQDNSISIQLPAGAAFRASSGQGDLTITPSLIAPSIEFPSTVTDLEILLSAPARDAQTVEVPFRMPLPRVRWRWVFPEQARGPEPFDTKSIEMPAAALLSSPTAFCQLKMHRIAKFQNRFSLCLTEGDDILQEEPFDTIAREPHLLHKPLAPFADTVRRYAESHALEFRVRIQERDVPDYPIAFVAQEFSFTNMRLTPINEYTWRLQWNEAAPVHNRRLQVQSLWRPWQKPLEFSIKDTCHDSFVLEETGLPAGRYVLRMASAPRRLPFPQRATSAIVDLGNGSELLTREISSVPPERCFFDTLEKALALSCVGAPIEKEIDTCVKIVAQGIITRISPLLAFYTWLREDPGRAPDVEAVLHWMFQPAVLQSIFSQEGRKDPLREKYLSLLEDLTMISRDSLVLILSHMEENPTLTALCWRQLIARRDSPNGYSLVETIRLLETAITDERLFPKDAATLLVPIASEVLSYYLKHPPSGPGTLFAFLLPHSANLAQDLAKLDSPTLARLAIYPIAPAAHAGILAALVARHDPTGITQSVRDYFDQVTSADDTFRIWNLDKDFSRRILRELPMDAALTELLRAWEEPTAQNTEKE